jgi:hypothetical protein
VISTRCLNNTCVRHLVALHRTELARAVNKARGGRHYNARLNREQVHQILNLYKAGQYNQRQLAERCHVSKGAVSQLICGAVLPGYLIHCTGCPPPSSSRRWQESPLVTAQQSNCDAVRGTDRAGCPCFTSRRTRSGTASSVTVISAARVRAGRGW